MSPTSQPSDGRAPRRRRPGLVVGAPAKVVGGSGLRSGGRLWIRLVAIAALPLLGMGWSTLSIAVSRSRTADRAHSTARQMGRLEYLLQLSAGLRAERVPAQTLLVATSYGLPPGAVRLYVGFDPWERRAVTRGQLDRALTAGDDRVAVEIRRQIASTRSRVDAPSATSSVVAAEYGHLEEVVDSAIESQLDSIIAITPTIGSSAEVARSVRALGALLDASNAAAAQNPPLLHLVQGVGTESDHQELSGQIALEQAALRRMQPDLAPAAASIVLATSTDPNIRQFRSWVEDRITAELGTSSDPLASGRMFRGGLDVLSGYDRAVSAVIDEAVGHAQHAQRMAEEALQRAVTLAAALALASLLLVLRLTRSITQPLRVLADRAGQMVDGAIEHEPIHAGGPAELAVVERALNEALANLASIQAQAHALANGALDDPVLQTPTAGALGQSIQVTLDRLSQSIRDREELQGRLAHQANHDALTLLPNRTAALQTLDHVLARARRTGGIVALLFIDLDGFKRANDEHGHPFGDKVLRLAAQRLLGSVRAGDKVARLGGDEFVVIAEQVSDADEAVATANRLIEDLSMSMEIEGKQVRVGASVGIAVSVDAAHDADEMLRQADVAVYRAKSRGRGRCEIFDEALRVEMSEAVDIEHSLQRALADGEFSLQYQPVVDAATGVLEGVEAMLRWDREGPAIAPSVFVPIAEASLLIVDIDRWVLTQALSQLEAWAQVPGMADLELAVNVSGRYLLTPHFVEEVRTALERRHIAPERLVVEITESRLLGDFPTAVEHLAALRAIGVQVAIDDFGTGYTSIGQIGSLPLDLLKIDRSLIGRVDRPSERAIVELVIEVGHTLDLGLVAKGVETAEQVEALRELGCNQLQGFRFSRPLAPPDLQAWVAAHDAVRRVDAAEQAKLVNHPSAR